MIVSIAKKMCARSILFMIDLYIIYDSIWLSLISYKQFSILARDYLSF